MQLALVVVVFALCWCPLNLYHLLVDFGLAKANFNVFLVCHWIAMSSVCYNVSLMNFEHQNNNNKPSNPISNFRKPTLGEANLPHFTFPQPRIVLKIEKFSFCSMFCSVRALCSALVWIMHDFQLKYGPEMASHWATDSDGVQAKWPWTKWSTTGQATILIKFCLHNSWWALVVVRCEIGVEFGKRRTQKGPQSSSTLFFQTGTRITFTINLSLGSWTCMLVPR